MRTDDMVGKYYCFASNAQQLMLLMLLKGIAISLEDHTGERGTINIGNSTL